MIDIKERREELRYPLSDVYRKYVLCKMHDYGTEYIDAQLLEFSMNGLKIRSPVRKEVDSEMECVISLPKLYSKELRTKIKIRHSTPSRENEHYILGAQIIDADKNYLARVFAKILEFVTSKRGVLY